jgi:hypothetical protein
VKTSISTAVLVIFAATAAFCTPVTYSFSGIASGTVGVTAFNNVTFNVTSFADTSLVTLIGSTWQVQATSTTLNIAGFSPITFAGSTFWGVPQGSSDVIFANSAISIPTGLLGITSVDLLTYDLRSSIGPLFSGLDFESSVFHNFTNIPTSQGLVTLTAANDTFTASVAPEPASESFLGVGVLALFVYRIRQYSQR